MGELYLKIYGIGVVVGIALGFIVLTARSVVSTHYEGDCEIPIWVVGSFIWPLSVYVGVCFVVGLAIGELWDKYTEWKWLKEQGE